LAPPVSYDLQQWTALPVQDATTTKQFTGQPADRRADGELVGCEVG
jgi:hypothetical protein